jgi:hypothetical protein
MHLPWERQLWKDGLIGYAVRAIYHLTWRRIRWIPDNERLWRALHKRDQVYAKTGMIKPSFFRDRSGLSCDLARFTTPEASRLGHGDQDSPAEAGLVEFRALDVRRCGSDVQHAPVKTPRPNYAHSMFTSVVEGTEGEDLARAACFRIPHRLRG